MALDADHIEIPQTYYPSGIGPGGFSPAVLRAHAEMSQKGMWHEHEVKDWIILYFLDRLNEQMELREALEEIKKLADGIIASPLTRPKISDVLEISNMSRRLLNTTLPIAPKFYPKAS